MKAHKQTVYLIQDEKGKLTVVQYAPTMNYAGRRDSDQYALMQGLFIDNISHDLWLNSVSCHRNIGTHSGIHTIKNLTCKIVAKKSFLWDMSASIGKRELEPKKTSNFDATLKEYHKQHQHK